MQVKTIGTAHQKGDGKRSLHVLKMTSDAMKIDFNGPRSTGYLQGRSRWHSPNWLWHFFWCLFALGPHWLTQDATPQWILSDSYSLPVVDRGRGVRKVGQPLQCLSEHSSSRQLNRRAGSAVDLKAPSTLQHLVFDQNPTSFCPLPVILKTTWPMKHQPGDGGQLRNISTPIYKALLILGAAPVNTIISFSDVSEGGRSSFFQSNTAETPLC